jgi:pimeloyl-ACP methyl ester carboxylesterase
MRVSNNGVDIEVVVDDPGDGDGNGNGNGNGGTQREPLVLLMGIGAQLVLWPDEFCARLCERGFRVIRMDNRDIGRSSYLHHMPVPDPRTSLLRATLGLRVAAPYTLTDMAGDVRAVLDALGIERAHVVGASMGGMIAQTLALEHPERVTSLTSIMSSPGDRRYAFGARPAALRALLGPPPRTRDEAVARILRTFQAIGSRTHPVDKVLMSDIAARSFDRGVNPAGFARHMAAICASGSRSAALRTLRVPTLVIHGTQDPLIPVQAGRATARMIAGARLLELSDMGHDLPRPLWDTLADAIRSIARDAATTAR